MKMRLPLGSGTSVIAGAGGGVGRLTRRLGMSPAEATFLLAALAFLATVCTFWFLRVRPLSAQAEALRARERELRLAVDRRNADEKKRLDQIANSEAILESLIRFESGLKPDMRGMTQIIEEIDTLGKKNKVLVGDASYRVEEAAALTDEKGAPLPESSTLEKNLTIYPVMGIETTIIGDYPNLRRFLAELERSRQFLIIRALAFQGEADKVRSETAKLGGSNRLEMSSPESIPVSLKIELDTYFRRSRPDGESLARRQ